MKDYDMSVFYHPRKANLVAAALSSMTVGSMSHVEEGKKGLVKYVHNWLDWVFGWKIPQIVV